MNGSRDTASSSDSLDVIVTHRELLLSHLEPPRRDEVSAIADLDAILAGQYAEATAAWPSVSLPIERYFAHLAKRIGERTSEPAERVIATLPAADLYLAAACADGDQTAIGTFRDAFVPSLRQALGKLAMPSSTLDEAVQRVLVMVFVGESPQIRNYAGRGSLRSWLRSIGVRTARRMLGVEHAEAGAGDGEINELPAAVRDPELELLRVRYRDDVKRAFAAAFQQLDERQRNILRQYHIDGLTIDQLAALYHVNRATTARWVAGARLAIVKATRAQLIEHAGVPPTDVDSVIRLVRSQLDLSVREL
jgi:RNA polymerase sigma-70 factor, ECF subfamily